MGAKKPQYIKSIDIGEIANNWPLGAVPFLSVAFSVLLFFYFLIMNLSFNRYAILLSDAYHGNEKVFKCFTSRFD